MADSSELEAELLAALGSMPDVGADTPAPQVQPQPQPQPQLQPQAQPGHVTLPDPLSAAAPKSILPPTPPPPAVSVQSLPPVSTPTDTPTPTTATLSLPSPTPPVAGTLPATSPVTKTPVPLAQSLAAALDPPRSDAASQQPPQAAGPMPVPPNGALGACPPKRPASPGQHEGEPPKRQKTDQAEPNPDETEPNIDLATMLNHALAKLDQQTNPGDHDTIMRDLDLAQPAAPASTASEADKPENKIVKISSNPIYVMRSMSLPLLGNAAVQILLRLSQQPRAETEALLADTDSEFRKSYDMLRDMFRATRKAFSDSPLLSPDELDITDSEDRETIRMSNLAAAGASVFGAHEVSLGDLHDAFFSIFIPEDGEYKSSLTELLLCLKTRLLLDALNKPDQAQPVSQLLDLLFPVNFDETLRQRSGELHLSHDEDSLVTQLRERREQLVKSAADEPIKKSLENQSSPERFAESMSAFLQGHLGVVVDYAEKYGVNIPLNEEETTALRDVNGVQQLEEHDSIAALLQSATSHLIQNEASTGHVKPALSNGTRTEQLGPIDDDGDELKKLLEETLSKHAPEPKEPSTDQPAASGVPDFDSKNLASFINEKLNSENLHLPDGLPNLSVSGNTTNMGPAIHPQYMNLPNQHPYQVYNQGGNPTAAVGAGEEVLPPNQSMPTAALYEKARQAAVAKSSNTQRREGLHSTRRPWSPEEEKALMAGLDMVKGPHWSQILSLFGANGSVSTILKDRSQVQLKDKARNLKLFFLKTNSEMPYYLQSVTGELKTRAPTQAARKEAEEKARMNIEEDKARLNGIMTLAGGFQTNNHRTAGAPLAAPPPGVTSPGTPAASATPPTMHTHMATSTGAAALSQVPISPRVKTEQADHHVMPKSTAFPPIQPAPVPTSGAPQARPHLAHLQPQPGLPHQQQQGQHSQQGPQQQGQRPMPAVSQSQQQRQPQPQQQLQQARLHQQPQGQAQSHPYPPTQTQTQQQRLLQQPQHQQAQPQLHPYAHSQQVVQPASPTTKPSPTQQQTGFQQQRQPHQQASPAVQANQPLPTPPIPPNHHSTPDHAQDAKIMETLRAALAATNDNGGGQAQSQNLNQSPRQGYQSPSQAPSQALGQNVNQVHNPSPNQTQSQSPGQSPENVNQIPASTLNQVQIQTARNLGSSSLGPAVPSMVAGSASTAVPATGAGTAAVGSEKSTSGTAATASPATAAT
ncbi:hypothetical protein VTI74DRAFT_10295 [Chaetomium olivicolor]